ncbi:hypothetical protein F5Y03DRAFT_363309 [Xylaria venustula]|nr:hypothetical protein F5Y03DRAFT_363309 [Xylaria venustula]
MTITIYSEWRTSMGNGNIMPPNSGDGVTRGSMTVADSRLKLNKTSKIIIQTFLGTMVLFGGIAWGCVDMRVLPQNSYPIASSMALLAGSRLIRGEGTTQVPNGSREQEQRIKRKALVILKRRRFCLGWWEDSVSQPIGHAGDSAQAL